MANVVHVVNGSGGAFLSFVTLCSSQCRIGFSRRIHCICGRVHESQGMCQGLFGVRENHADFGSFVKEKWKPKLTMKGIALVKYSSYFRQSAMIGSKWKFLALKKKGAHFVAATDVNATHGLQTVFSTNNCRFD